MRHAPRYALTPDEVESLRALLRDEAEGEEPAEGRGADHSAVVLSRDRFVPHEGKLVDEP